jgi:hypothetical protein
VKIFRTTGMIFYSILALTAIATVAAHSIQLQNELRFERRLLSEFLKA